MKNRSGIFRLHLLIMILLLSPAMKGTTNDSTKKIHCLIIPAVYRSPETGWAGGLATSISFKTSDKKDSLTRTSVIQGIAFYTTKGQNVQAIDATIYFPKEKYIYNNQISHSYFPDKFWGLGPDTKDKNKEPYIYEQYYFFPRLQHKFRKNFFSGLLYEYQDVVKVNYLKGGVFDASPIYGKNRYHVSGLGFSTTYDSRNLSFWPTKGILIESLLDKFDKHIGSQFNFVKWTLDFRYFQQFIGKTVFAMQLYNYSTFGKTPLRDQASLGGAGNMRGIYDGRFRDYNMSSMIVEFRIPIVWRLSLCTFGDIGNVYKKPKDLYTSSLKYSYGEGLRIALLKKEKLNLRLDYGYYSRNNQGFYLNIGECF